MDRTAEIAEKMGVKVMVQEGKGKGRAVSQALNEVKEDTRYGVVIDADYTYRRSISQR